MGTGLTNQLYWLIVVLCNAIVRPPSPPPREDSHGTVNRPKGSDCTGGEDPGHEKTPVLPCWRVRE